jgi:hypothetical protein
VERSNAIRPEIRWPGSSRINRSDRSVPLTVTSITLQSVALAGGAAAAARVPAPDRATIVYSPGETPGIEYPAAVTIPRGSMSAPEDTSRSAGAGRSRWRGNSEIVAAVTGWPVSSTIGPEMVATGTIRTVMSTPLCSSPARSVRAAADATSGEPG